MSSWVTEIEKEVQKLERQLNKKLTDLETVQEENFLKLTAKKEKSPPKETNDTKIHENKIDESTIQVIPMSPLRNEIIQREFNSKTGNVGNYNVHNFTPPSKKENFSPKATPKVKPIELSKKPKTRTKSVITLPEIDGDLLSERTRRKYDIKVSQLRDVCPYSKHIVVTHRRRVVSSKKKRPESQTPTNDLKSQLTSKLSCLSEIEETPSERMTLRERDNKD